jgi:hypothetical protein
MACITLPLSSQSMFKSVQTHETKTVLLNIPGVGCFLSGLPRPVQFTRGG